MIHQMRSDLATIAQDVALYVEMNFTGRVKAIDYIEFKVIERIEGLLATSNGSKELLRLKQYAEGLKGQLETIDEKLFQRLRADMKMGSCTGAALKGLIGEYIRPGSTNSQQDRIGYDNLDLFINGLLLTQAIPLETKIREPEMVYYQQTPTRIIFELIEKAHFNKDDVFYDLGSGLGQVPILVNLLSGVVAKGIEFEPAYCHYARVCAAGLNLSNVTFINEDARNGDYSEGTVFFTYTF